MFVYIRLIKDLKLSTYTIIDFSKSFLRRIRFGAHWLVLVYAGFATLTASPIALWRRADSVGSSAARSMSQVIAQLPVFGPENERKTQSKSKIRSNSKVYRSIA